jgi:hypothetical protein
MSASTTIQSPDGKYTVEQQDDFGEIGMGSPAFGHITFRGAHVQFPDYLFGEAVVFSPDSRFVALEQLVETTPFRTKLIAVELPRGTVHFIRLQPQGTATPQRWETATRLSYRVWSVGSAAEMQSWDAPSVHAEPAKRDWSKIWIHVFFGALLGAFLGFRIWSHSDDALSTSWLPGIAYIGGGALFIAVIAGLAAESGWDER